MNSNRTLSQKRGDWPDRETERVIDPVWLARSNYTRLVGVVVRVHASNKPVANPLVKPSAPVGPARMDLAGADGRKRKRPKRCGRESEKLVISSGKSEGPKDPSAAGITG